MTHLMSFIIPVLYSTFLSRKYFFEKASCGLVFLVSISLTKLVHLVLVDGCILQCQCHCCAQVK